MAEAILIYLLLMLAFGPGTFVYGLLTIARKKVRATRKLTLQGAPAVAAGLVLMIVGCATTWFFWTMGAYLPP
ncbi:hypothetical protein [Paludisphaera rhizosphaerae]|uniref:hypothetical protein n=1 Tax=Paludisphaera rhizosphaerae TaxID=2711216 RepID=UPI0013ED720C|nr:hypothetical protein [Paludisphaera rhizosphaerae]